jgi:hypothetical protein
MEQLELRSASGADMRDSGRRDHSFASFGIDTRQRRKPARRPLTDLLPRERRAQNGLGSRRTRA